MAEIDQVAEIADVTDLTDKENIDVVREFNEEVDSIRKQLRMAAAMRGSNCLPNVGPITHVPHLRTKNELHSLDALSNHPDYKDVSRFVYQCEKETKSVNHWRHNGPSPVQNKNKCVWVEKQGRATDVAQWAARDGGYMTNVDTMSSKLKNRDLLVQEKFMVESLARMKMCTVKREKQANNLREALQEWIEDARILVQLDDEDAFFSIVSAINEDETKEGEKKEEKEEEKEVKKEDKKKNKKSKNKENSETKENKNNDEKEEAPEPEVISLSFTTRFFGVNYSISVEMRNEEDVRVETLPVLKGIEQKIADILIVSTLLDAVTFEFWKTMEA